MYSYSVISIHPKTFCVANRGYYTTYRDAVNALREEATDYITKYKRYQTVVYVNSDEEMVNHPDVKYFLKISDQFPNRIEVLERHKIVTKGWIWNGKSYEVELIKLFDIISANLPNGQNIVTSDDDFQWVNNIQKESKQNYTEHANQAKVMDELREALNKRRKKFHSD